MKNWKRVLEDALANEYPGTAIKWNGGDPILVIPDEFINKADEIVKFATKLWEAWGGSVEFYPERAVKTTG